MGQQSRQEPRFADLAILLSTRPGGQEWQEVTKKKQKNEQIQAAAAAVQPDPIKLKPGKDSPKEARRLLFRREGGKAAPRSERGYHTGHQPSSSKRTLPRSHPGGGNRIHQYRSDHGSPGQMRPGLIPNYKDLLVTAARQADPAVISVEFQEQWYRVKSMGPN